MKSRILEKVLKRKKEYSVADHLKLPLALSLAAVIALILTVISVIIYNVSGANHLDLSRPGFEREREEVRQTEPTKTYDTTSPIDRQAIEEFLDEYDKRNVDLDEYGDFSGDDLNDSHLQLTQ